MDGITLRLITEIAQSDTIKVNEGDIEIFSHNPVWLAVRQMIIMNMNVALQALANPATSDRDMRIAQGLLKGCNQVMRLDVLKKWDTAEATAEQIQKNSLNQEKVLDSLTQLG